MDRCIIDEARSLSCLRSAGPAVDACVHDSGDQRLDPGHAGPGEAADRARWGEGSDRSSRPTATAMLHAQDESHRHGWIMDQTERVFGAAAARLSTHHQ